MSTHLIDPAGAETERGRRQQHIFHCCTGIEKAVAVVALAGYDEKGSRCEKIVAGRTIVRLSDGGGKCLNFFRVCEQRKMPALFIATGRCPDSSGQQILQLFRFHRLLRKAAARVSVQNIL